MKKLDDRGFSLVELMLAMAMMAIVAVGALTIFNSATKSYQYSNNELNLQTEAQMLINQIEERALTANNVSYDRLSSVASGSGITTNGADDYLLTLYNIKYFNKTCSAVTQQAIFWIHKGSDAHKDTVFLFTQSLAEDTRNNLAVVEANLATTASITTAAFVQPAVAAANAEMSALRQAVLDDIEDALSNAASMENVYKRHMLARGVDTFNCDALSASTGGFDEDRSDLSVSIKLKSIYREYEVSDVAHLRSKIRKIP